MQEIIISVVSIIITGLASWLVKKLVDWLDSKIKDTKAKSLLTNAIESVSNAVKVTYQTYVDALKKEGKFDKEAQEKALILAKNTAMEAMSNEVQDYIQENFGSLGRWLNQTIESTLYDLKNNKKL